MEINIAAVLASLSGALSTILISIVIHELRQIRSDMKSFVTDKQCHIMMSNHEQDIESIKKTIQIHDRDLIEIKTKSRI